MTPSLYNVPILDFQKPATGAGTGVTTSFGSIELIGYHESSNIDSDLTKAGLGGTVLANSPDSNTIGYGEIRLHGALGVSISFYYGTRADQHSATKGGFTGFTYTQTQADASRPGAFVQPPPEDVFKQFALNQGQPIGPVDPPLTGPGVTGSGPGYFNSFYWTSGTFAGNVFDVSRSGSSQIDNVKLVVDPVRDIIEGSKLDVRDSTTDSTIPTGGMYAEWIPGDRYTLRLADLAEAGGYSHFNWLQTIIGDPMPIPDKSGKLPTTDNKGRYTYFDPLPGGYLGQDNHDTAPFYYDVPGFQGGNPKNLVTSKIIETPLIGGDTLTFGDRPSSPGIATKFPGKSIQFITTLVGVKPNGQWEPFHSFSWSSDYDASAGTGNTTIYKSTLFDEVGNGGTGGSHIIDADVTLDELPPEVLSLWASSGADLTQASLHATDDEGTTAVGTTVVIPVLANDLGRVDTTSVSIVSAPSNGSVVVDPTSGAVSYSPLPGFTGADTFRYTVMDVSGTISNVATVTITVGSTATNHAPVLTAIPGQSATEGTKLTLTAQATDQDTGDTLTYSLDPSAPAGAAIDPNTGAFSFTPGVGPAIYNVTVKVTDNGSPALSDSTTFAITVANVAPSVSAGGNGTATVGTAFTRGGAFTDPGTADSWTATVNYGDGSGDLPLALNPDKTFLLGHTYSTAGLYTTIVTVVDQGGDSGSSSFDVDVVAQPVVTAFVVNGGAIQRSMVQLLTTSFSSIVTLDTDAFQLSVPSTAKPVTLVVTPKVVGGVTVVDISFIGAGIIAGSLEDGVYTLNLTASRVHDAFGQILAGGDQSYSLFRLFGDIDGNRVVDNQDLYGFQKAYNSHAGDANYVPAFDFSGTGVIDSNSLTQIMKRRNKRV